MRRTISWAKRCEDGVKREVRAHVCHQSIKWQFKRHDEEHWDYDSPPQPADWDELEDILVRRAGRGKGGTLLESVRKMRRKEHV